jgi:hypothetical protein
MYPLAYVLQCLLLHSAFALLWASPVLCLMWITWRRGSLDRRTYWSLCLLGTALACTSHYLADLWALGF